MSAPRGTTVMTPSMRESRLARALEALEADTPGPEPVLTWATRLQTAEEGLKRFSFFFFAKTVE